MRFPRAKRENHVAKLVDFASIFNAFLMYFACSRTGCVFTRFEERPAA